MTGFIDDIIKSHHPMTSMVEKSLAQKITHGDPHGFQDIEKISNNHIVAALGTAVQSKPDPHKVASFMEMLDARGMMNSVVKSFFHQGDHKEAQPLNEALHKGESFDSAVNKFLTKSESFVEKGAHTVEEGTKSAIKHGYKALTTINRSVSGKAIDVAADLISVGFDPTGLRGVQLAADTAVLLLRAAESQMDQKKRPILFGFIDSVAMAGELTGTAAAIASDMTGVGILSEIVQQTAQWAIKEALQAAMEKTQSNLDKAAGMEKTKTNLDKAVNELPAEKSQAVKETTPEQAKAALEKVEVQVQSTAEVPNLNSQSHGR